MRKITLLSLLGILVISSCQEETASYDELITQARNSYQAGEYDISGRIYAEAFETGEGRDSFEHHYEAARAWALADVKDSAFAQLRNITGDGKYIDLAQISTDNDLNVLRSDERWIQLLNEVSANRKEAVAEMASVAAILDSVYEEDQKYRQQLGEIEETYGRDSEEMTSHWELINKTDSINLVKVKSILEEYGWLGPDFIGGRGNTALFLVIQHADIETQEKYLPVLREAVKLGNAPGPDLALLEDRVALRQGKKQIYGSQIGRDPETGEYYVSPLLDPEHVDQRRAEVGLAPLQDYISNWGMTWNVDDYVQRLPELEAKQGM